jgi:hypothetical protein
LNANLNSAQTSGSYTITLTKPGKSNVTQTSYFGNLSINSYTSPQATNNSNTQTEVWLDEAYRTPSTAGSGWASGSALVDGNLQVQNGRLICGRYGNNYQTFISGSTSDAATYAMYYRKSITGTSARINGTFTFTRNANAFASVNPVSAWDSGTGKLEIAMYLSTQPSNIYDLGRNVGINDGNIYGICSSITTNNSTIWNVSWGYPELINTGDISTEYVVIMVRYRNTSNTDYITNIAVVYN